MVERRDGEGEGAGKLDRWRKRRTRSERSVREVGRVGV